MIVVAIVGLYFLTLGVVSIVSPTKAQNFLLGFADSPAKHYTELAIRFVAGGALVFHAPQMRFAVAFAVFGWILLATTFGLLLIPWQWHDRFAQKSVPAALRYLKLIGIVSIALGGVFLYSMFPA